MNSVGSSKYYSEIDILKGVAILTVVLEHAFAVKYINLTEIGWCYHTVEVIKSFNMQLFFAISGFLFANSKQYDIRKAFKGKFDRLLVPMLFFAAISLFLSIFLSSYFSSETTVSKSMLIDWFVYGECNWFVYTLLVIFCLMIPFKKRLTPALVIGISLALIVLKELGLVHARIFQIHHVLYMLVFFFLGYLTYVYYDVVRPFISKWYICGLCIVSYVFLYQIKEVSFVRNWALPITLGTGLWGGVILLSDKSESKLLQYFGKNSLQFYLFNGFALVPARVLCAHVLKIQEPFVLVSLVFIVCLILLFLFTEISRRIPVISYLCGFGRKKWVKS